MLRFLPGERIRLVDGRIVTVTNWNGLDGKALDEMSNESVTINLENVLYKY